MDNAGGQKEFTHQDKMFPQLSTHRLQVGPYKSEELVTDQPPKQPAGNCCPSAQQRGQADTASAGSHGTAGSSLGLS